jgi:nicotinate phosphoribosyltransferase
MVQTFIALGGSELDAFRAYADLYPDNCLLLVDTLDSLESGIPNAIRVFEELKRKGYRPVGIRLDSGDLAYLSIQAARMLDAAGFPDTSIVLSNNLDELIIWQIVTQIEGEAPRYGVDPGRLIGRLVYGVGTRLVTSHGDPALDGVYKLVAVEKLGAWVPALKISETPAKTLNPGNKQAWRLYDRRTKAIADVLALDTEDLHAPGPLCLHHPTVQDRQRTLQRAELSGVESLLVDVLRQGQLVYELPSIDLIRDRRQADLDRLDPGVKRLVNPHAYHVSLTRELWSLKQGLIDAVRAKP